MEQWPELLEILKPVEIFSEQSIPFEVILQSKTLKGVHLYVEPDEVKDLSVVESLLSKFSHVEVKVGIGRGEDELGPEMPTQEVIALINGVLRLLRFGFSPNLESFWFVAKWSYWATESPTLEELTEMFKNFNPTRVDRHQEYPPSLYLGLFNKGLECTIRQAETTFQLNMDIFYVWIRYKSEEDP